MSANKEILMKFITAQNEKIRKDVSMQGYKDTSPYKNNPSNTIYGSPQGTPITMKGVSTPLIGTDEFGNMQEMVPGEEYFFPGSRVKETRMQNGGQNLYNVSMNNPMIVPSQGMNPVGYYDTLPKNEAGIPYDKDGTLFTQSKMVSRFDENGKPLSAFQVRENQKMWNMQKMAYSPEQQTFNLWKNNPQNTEQGFYNTREYGKYLKNIIPTGKDVGLDGLCDPNFSSTKCGTSKQHAKEDKKEWSKKQEGGEQDFTNVQEWFNKYIDSPLYRRNIENSGYENVDDVIDQRKANVNRTGYELDENRLGTYYKNTSNKIYNAPKTDSKNWSKQYPSVLPNDSVLAHEFGHAVLDSNQSWFGSLKPFWNKNDYDQLESRNKNKRVSRGAMENYADQKELQYTAAKLGIYNPGFEEFTEEHLDKLPTDLKDRALQNYSKEDLIWLMNNIAQNDDNSNDQLAIAQEGKEITIDEGDGKKRKILTDSKEYANLYNEDRIGVQNDDGSISFNPFNEVVITPYDKEYPFYQELSDEEKKYFNDDTPIGRAVRRKAYTKNSLSEDVTDIAAPILYGTAAAMLAPYALAPLAGGLEFAGAAAAPYIEGALATSLPGMSSIPGATVGNAINAGFAGHGLANIGPDAVKMYNDPSWSNAGNVGMDVVESLPVARPALKIIGEGAGTLKKGFNALNDFAKNKELLRLERQAQNYYNNRLNNLDIEEVRRAFHNSERFLSNEEVDLLRRHGRGASENYTIPPPPPLENQSGMIGVSEADYTLEGALRRLHSGAPLEQEHINVLGNEYNANQLSITDSDAFGRYIVGNRGSINLRRGATSNVDNTNGWGTGNWNPNGGGRTYQLDDPYNIPVGKNRSGFTKESLIKKADDAEKKILENMSDDEFAKTVTKPSGQTVPYVDGPSISQMTYNSDYGKMIHSDAVPMTSEAYADIFNNNINRLNEIIAKNNRSGVQYQVEKLYPNGQLKFVTPEQTTRVPNNKFKIKLIDNSNDANAPSPYHVEYSNHPEHADIQFFESKTEAENFVNQFNKNQPEFVDVKIDAGTTQWDTPINAGTWKGQVEDIPNTEYFKSIPGLNMSITSSSPFADRVRREGSGAYKSINEFLKELELGRVKPGFNSQTKASFGAWDHFAKKGDAVGYYGNPDLFYGVFKKKGGSINVPDFNFEKHANKQMRYDIGGTTVAEQYTEITGKPWRTARAEGLTDGSARQNLALIKKLKENQQVVETPKMVPPPVNVVNTSDNTGHTKEMAQRVVQLAEERIKNNRYIDVPEDIKKVAFERGEDAYGCIGGVCTIYKEAGLMNNVDWSNTHFAEKAKDYGFTANKGWGVKGLQNLEPGDMLMTNQRKNEQGNYYPSHSQIYLGKTKSGQLRFFDNFWKTERTYFEDEIKERLDPARKKTEVSATIYKVNPYDNSNPMGLTPEELQKYNDKKEFIEKESKSKQSYVWGVSEKAKNYNDTTKRVIDSFIEYANDNDKINDLVKKTGKSKEEIHDSLLNVFGELGAENNWTTSKGKGIGSRFENIAESVITAFGGGKKLSVGPGQIKYQFIPKDLKEKFDIQSPNDLYDLEKVLPLMTALDLRDKQVLEKWGENNVLSKKLFGWTRPEVVEPDGTVTGGFKADQLHTETDGSRLNNGVGRYSPYLRNQYSSINSGLTYINGDDWVPFNEGTMTNFSEARFNESGKDEMKIKYQRNQGSYPYKVEQNWRNNLNRTIYTIQPSESPEELDVVVIEAIKKKKSEMGGMLYANKDAGLPHQQSMTKYLSDQNNLLEFMKRVKVVGGSVPFDEYYKQNIIFPRNKS